MLIVIQTWIRSWSSLFPTNGSTGASSHTATWRVLVFQIWFGWSLSRTKRNIPQKPYLVRHLHNNLTWFLRYGFCEVCRTTHRQKHDEMLVFEMWFRWSLSEIRDTHWWVNLLSESTKSGLFAVHGFWDMCMVWVKSVTDKTHHISKTKTRQVALCVLVRGKTWLSMVFEIWFVWSLSHNTSIKMWQNVGFWDVVCHH